MDKKEFLTKQIEEQEKFKLARQLLERSHQIIFSNEDHPVNVIGRKIDAISQRLTSEKMNTATAKKLNREIESLGTDQEVARADLMIQILKEELNAENNS